MSLATTAQEDAGTKFWRMPELIERLLEYLDEFSILSIVGLNLLTVEVLQSASRTSSTATSHLLMQRGLSRSLPSISPSSWLPNSALVLNAKMQISQELCIDLNVLSHRVTMYIITDT